ncbi:MAG: hypothetical protein J6J55_04260 [Paludibacteraceae bacterium]|nr:hypothetical protein [Paludibacteraceae bacterium]
MGMKAEIITIGDELLIGQVVDTNSAWMAQRLNEYGIVLHQITSVHDDRQHILTAIDEAFGHADIVLTTGGLGPTKDDITKQVLCEYFSTSLVEDIRVREHIYSWYKERPDVLNRLTATQWLVPKSATILPNRVGSAPIMVFEKGAIDNEAIGERLEARGMGKKLLVAMPGMPHEMQIAMTEQVLPYLANILYPQGGTPADYGTRIVHRSIKVRGIAESTLAIHIEDWENALPENIRLAYLPKNGTITLRLSGYGVTTEMVEEQLKKLRSLVYDYEVSHEE